MSAMIKLAYAKNPVKYFYLDSLSFIYLLAIKNITMNSCNERILNPDKILKILYQKSNIFETQYDLQQLYVLYA